MAYEDPRRQSRPRPQAQQYARARYQQPRQQAVRQGVPAGGFVPDFDVSRDSVRYRRPVRRKSKAPLIVALLVLAALLAVAAWWFLVPKPFDVTLNDQTFTVEPETTAAQLLEDKGIALQAGNLLALDGTILEQGGGQPGYVTNGGEPIDASAPLSAGMALATATGADVTEEAVEAQEPIPFTQVNDDRGFYNYWGGSIHLLADGRDGVRVTRTGSVSGITTSEVTEEPVAGGYQVYTAAPADPVVALTFDDGPWDGSTAEILDILEQYGAKATFFTIGNQVADHADVVRRAHEAGCEVLTHTWDHAAGSGGGVNLTYMSADEQVEEVTRGYAAIAEVLGEEPAHIMRAPGGNFHDEIIDTLWPYLDAEIGWDVDTEDWQQPGADVIASRIESLEPGQVALMHDGGGDRSQTVEALRAALPVLVEKGYRFVTISELLAYGNPELQGE